MNVGVVQIALPAHLGEQHDASGPNQEGVRQGGRVVTHHLDLEGRVVVEECDVLT